MAKEIQTYKAKSSDMCPVEDLVINVSKELGETPDYVKPERFLDWWSEFYEVCAEELEEALYNTLPGGLYDHLVGCFLRRKASHLTVPFGKQKDG